MEFGTEEPPKAETTGWDTAPTSNVSDTVKQEIWQLKQENCTAGWWWIIWNSFDPDEELTFLNCCES